MVLEYDSKSVQTMLEEAIVAIRENLGISSAIKMTTTTKGDSMIVPYVHGKVAGDGGSSSSNVTAGSAASIVEISGKGVVDDPRTALEIGKKLAMHIVAAKPLYLDPESIPDDILQKEKAMLETQVCSMYSV
jgi:elongation factor Ts